jgi:hypothetical protein
MSEIELIPGTDKIFTDLLKAKLESEPKVIIDWEEKTIDIFGGNSGYIKDDPYWISFGRIDQLDWLMHLAEKNWATAMMIAKLAKAMNEVRKFNNA